MFVNLHCKISYLCCNIYHLYCIICLYSYCIFILYQFYLFSVIFICILLLKFVLYEFFFQIYNRRSILYNAPFLCRLRSIAAHRDHFVKRLSVCMSVCMSVSHTFFVVKLSFVSQSTHTFLGMLPLFSCETFICVVLISNVDNQKEFLPRLIITGAIV